MKIDVYPQINLAGLNPQQALAKIAEHVNTLTDIVVQSHNRIEDLNQKVAELERQNSILLAQLRK
jgi:hypothetical protein